MKNTNEKENEEDLKIPQGTCKVEDYQKIEATKVALCSQFNQYVVFSSNINKLSWIIVKEQIEKNEPIFHLFCESIKKRFLSAQKQPNNIGCNYLISKNQKPQKNYGFVAKLRGNFRNNQFIVYDNGQNPKKKTGRKRKQFAAIKFNQQGIFSQGQQKQIQVIVPQVRRVNNEFNICPKYLPKQFIPNEEKDNLLYEQYQRKSQDVIKIVKFKQNPQKTTNEGEKINSLMQSLFSKRLGVKLSVKGSDCGDIVFELKTRSKNTCGLKFSHPLNMVQTFGIALTLFERQSN